MCGKGQQISHLFGPGTNVLICFWVSFLTVRPLRFRFCRRRQICCSSTKHIFCELDPVPGIYCDSVKNDCFRQRDTGYRNRNVWRTCKSKLSKLFISQPMRTGLRSRRVRGTLCATGRRVRVAASTPSPDQVLRGARPCYLAI